MEYNDDKEYSAPPKKKRRPEDGVDRPRRPRPKTEDGVERPRKPRPKTEDGVERPRKPRPKTEDGVERSRKPRPRTEDGVERPRRPRPQATGTAVSSKEGSEVSYRNSAKDTKRKDPKASKRRARQEALRDAKRFKKYKAVGIALASIQVIASIAFMVMLVMVNMLPFTYLAFLGTMLILLDGLIMVGQIKSKKKAIFGKIVAVIMSILFFVGTSYLYQGYVTMQNISGGNEIQVDMMVVAVLADDPAESLEDAIDYNYGVQYAMKGDEITATVEDINEALSTTITATEYASLTEQITALYEGEVDAVIYNQAYEGIFEEVYETYANDVKIIYTHELETEVEILVSEKEVADEAFVVYISGIDVYGSITTKSRSDVNILAVVNPTTHQILLVTTPRDYYVVLPGVSGDQEDKLTHAGIYGVDVSMDTLSAIYDDIEIDFYARVNFTSMELIVDALGGIDVYSSQSFTSSREGTTIYVEEGMNSFNGEEALIFARDRYNVSGGDFQRGVNQQEVIKAMIEKLISVDVIYGAMDILAAVSDNVDTNMTTAQMQDLVKDQIDTMSTWDIKMVDAEGTTSSQYCYSSMSSKSSVVLPDQESIDEIMVDINAVLDGELLEGADTIGD